MLVDPFKNRYFLLFFALFCTFYDFKVRKKLFLCQKMIPTGKRHAEHPFAGWNTQHIKWLNFLYAPILAWVRNINGLIAGVKKDSWSCYFFIV